MDSRQLLVRLMADGSLHAGPRLAEALGCSRSAVWKALRRLDDWGLDVQRLPGRGYRLAAALDLLDAQRICSALPPGSRDRLDDLELHWTLDSTNRRLRALPAPPAGRARACVAEFQTGGRGRRGRRWFSPLAGGLCLSLSRRFDSPPPGMNALGPAVGVMLRDVLAGPAPDARLKWPNDIVTPRGKLAGLLLEVDGEAGGPMKLIAGIGVNVGARPALPADESGALPPASLADAGPPPARSELAAALIVALIQGLDEFEADGFAPFVERWSRWDAFRDRAVTVATAGRALRRGIARGIAPDGALLLESGGRVEALYSGDVSVRPAA